MGKRRYTVRNENTEETSNNAKPLRLLNQAQKELVDAISHNQITFGLGPAGTGKTYVTVSCALEALKAGEVERIILTRPAIEAGESLGFIPGDINEKMYPYLIPLYDVLLDRVGGKKLKELIANKQIDIGPVAFMRGRTLSNSFVIIDEAQNCTYTQLKMLLTRIGFDSTMVIIGDPDQSDLGVSVTSLSDISEKLAQVNGISVVYLSNEDIVRNSLIGEMLRFI